MIKRILAFALTFAIALGGGTAVVVLRARASAPPANTAAAYGVAKPEAKEASLRPDSAAARDSASARVAVAASGGPAATTPRAMTPPHDSGRAVPARGTVQDSTKAAETRGPSNPVVVKAQPIAPATAVLASGRLAKIFGAMSARDAAKVLVADG